MENTKDAASDNICRYMAVSQVNKGAVQGGKGRLLPDDRANDEGRHPGFQPEERLPLSDRQLLSYPVFLKRPYAPMMNGMMTS